MAVSGGDGIGKERASRAGDKAPISRLLSPLPPNAFVLPKRP